MTLVLAFSQIFWLRKGFVGGRIDKKHLVPNKVRSSLMVVRLSSVAGQAAGLMGLPELLHRAQKKFKGKVYLKIKKS